MSENLVHTLFDNQPDAVMWFIPVFDPDDKSGRPVDFQAGYVNRSAGHFLKASPDLIIGTHLSNTPLLDEASRRSVFEQCYKVWETGNTLEFTYFNPALNKYLFTQRTKINGGILNITRDHTQLEQIRVESEKQTRLLDKLISNSPNGVSLYESIRNPAGDIIDFRLKLCNQKSAELTAFALEDLYKYTLKELMLIRGHSGYFEMCRRVVETGEPVYTEYFAQPRNQWLAFSIVKFDDGYLLNYIDITQTKMLEQQARQQAELLEGVLNASIAGLFALESICGFTGKILDFRFTLMNKAAERLLEIQIAGNNKTFLQLLPAARSNGLFELYCKVIEDGEPVTKVISFAGDGLKGNYLVSVSRKGDTGIVQSFSKMEG